MAVTQPNTSKYQVVPAGQKAAVIQTPSGESCDFIKSILVIPATTKVGAITLFDGATSFTVFVGGTVLDVRPFKIPLDMFFGKGEPWKISTGSNITAIVKGQFT